MARRPILQVPVDDAAFNRLFERMKDYQDMLDGLGDKWKDQDEHVTGIAATMVMVTAALEAQRETLHEQTEEMKAHREALEEKRRAENESAQKDKEAERRRKQMIEDYKRVAHTIKEATLDLGKWMFFGGAAGLVGSAASLWGLNKAVSWVSDQRRAATGLGVGIGERQALGARFGRFFDTDSVMERLANAQMDPRQAAVFAALGISPFGKDPAELSIDAAIAARRVLSRIPQQSRLAYAEATGISNIFSPDDLRRIMSEQPGGLEAQRDALLHDLPKLKIASETAEKWQDLLSTLEVKTLQVLDPLVTKLAGMEPALEVVITKFGDLAVQVLDRIDFDKLGAGLQAFANYIAGDKFQEDFKHFADGLGMVAAEIMVVANKLKWLIPAGPATAEQQTARRIGEDQRQVDAYRADIAQQQKLLASSQYWIGPGQKEYQARINRRIAADARGIADTEADMASVYAAVAAGRRGGTDTNLWSGVGDVAGGASPATSGVNDPITKNDRDAFAYFMSQGWGVHGSAALVAQLDAESGNTANPRGPNDGGLAYGAMQLHPDRQALFNQWAAERHLPDLRHASVQEQWAFMSWEARNKYQLVARQVMGARSAEEAGQIATTYEGPAHMRESRRDRGRRAAKIEITLKPTGTSLATSANNLAPGS